MEATQEQIELGFACENKLTPSLIKLREEILKLLNPKKNWKKERRRITNNRKGRQLDYIRKKNYCRIFMRKYKHCDLLKSYNFNKKNPDVVYLVYHLPIVRFQGEEEYFKGFYNQNK